MKLESKRKKISTGYEKRTARSDCFGRLGIFLSFKFCTSSIVKYACSNVQHIFQVKGLFFLKKQLSFDFCPSLLFKGKGMGEGGEDKEKY